MAAAIGTVGCAHVAPQLYAPMQPDGWSAQPVAVTRRFAPDAELDPATRTPVGDGAFLMTGTELLTAKAHRLGLIAFVFNDGELGGIAHFQQTPLNRKTCTVLPEYHIEGIAVATGSEYLRMTDDHALDRVMDEAIGIALQHKPVVVDVNIDYSRDALLANGVMKTNLRGFPARERMRLLARAVKRHVLG